MIFCKLHKKAKIRSSSNLYTVRYNGVAMVAEIHPHVFISPNILTLKYVHIKCPVTNAFPETSSKPNRLAMYNISRYAIGLIMDFPKQIKATNGTRELGFFMVLVVAWWLWL